MALVSSGRGVGPGGWREMQHDCLQYICRIAGPEATASCAAVCKQWNAICGDLLTDDGYWRGLCKQLLLPKPSPPTSTIAAAAAAAGKAPTREPSGSISPRSSALPSRQAYLTEVNWRRRRCRTRSHKDSCKHGDALVCHVLIAGSKIIAATMERLYCMWSLHVWDLDKDECYVTPLGDVQVLGLASCGNVLAAVTYPRWRVVEKAMYARLWDLSGPQLRLMCDARLWGADTPWTINDVMLHPGGKLTFVYEDPSLLLAAPAADGLALGMDQTRDALCVQSVEFDLDEWALVRTQRRVLPRSAGHRSFAALADWGSGLEVCAAASGAAGSHVVRLWAAATGDVLLEAQLHDAGTEDAGMWEVAIDVDRVWAVCLPPTDDLVRGVGRLADNQRGRTKVFCLDKATGGVLFSTEADLSRSVNYLSVPRIAGRRLLTVQSDPESPRGDRPALAVFEEDDGGIIQRDMLAVSGAAAAAKAAAAVGRTPAGGAAGGRALRPIMCYTVPLAADDGRVAVGRTTESLYLLDFNRP